MNDLAFVLVALPLLGAVVPFVLGRRAPEMARVVTVAVLIAHVAVAVVVAALVATGGPLTYVVGGLPAAVGIGLLVDQLSAVFVVLVAGTGAVAYGLLREEATGPGDGLWLLLVAGLTGVCVTADVFNLYVFLEISGLAAYALVAGRRGTTRALAALQYLLVGTAGATLYLLGVGYLYVSTGTLAMADLRVALPEVGYASPLVVAAFGFVVVGLGVKLALFPVHTWKPDAYAAAPVDVAVVLATLGSTVAGYALVRLVYGVFTVEFLTAVPAARTALLATGAVGVLVGGYLTLRQARLRRMLSYSSILQFGMVVVGIATATSAAITGAVLLLVANAVAKGGLFAAAGLFERTLGTPSIDALAGRGREFPVVSLAVAVAFASLVGLPPSVGFAGKWYVTVAAVETAEWTVLAVVLASTLISLAYAGRVVEVLYLSPDGNSGAVAADGGAAAPTTRFRGDWRTTALVAGAAVATVVLGVASSGLAAWIAPVVEVWL
ncbi:complex I subunit 5 family protein [Halobaculum marinum]|uniref:Complex I subunit 5 family protein n=1 Tax=Halobaculum marinum TaxID=3031996 RepID=A0ABD5WQN2_9EURY|nr:proton-conducting transporter membrane subunit [Halobaculum sp. DT55]